MIARRLFPAFSRVTPIVNRPTPASTLQSTSIHVYPPMPALTLHMGVTFAIPPNRSPMNRKYRAGVMALKVGRLTGLGVGPVP